MEYQIIRSKRKSIGITITAEGKVLVKAPKGVGKREIHRLLEEKRDWIEKHIEKIEARGILPVREVEPSLESLYRHMASDILAQECAKYAGIMEVEYGRITIRDQKSRWGSCSSQGNLNFNWRLMLLPPLVARYVVVHELAHLEHMNHSKAFWDVVEEVMPDYKKYRTWLRNQGHKYIRR